MEDLFANPHSDIPDALWKSASPMERQLAAVEYWAELRGVEKTAASAETLSKKLRKLLAKEHVPEAIGGTLGLGLGAGTSLYLSRKKGDSTAEQLDLRAERKSLDEKKRQERGSKLDESLYDIKKKSADVREKNPKTVAALSGLGTGALTAYLTHRGLKS